MIDTVLMLKFIVLKGSTKMKMILKYVYDDNDYFTLEFHTPYGKEFITVPKKEYPVIDYNTVKDILESGRY